MINEALVRTKSHELDLPFANVLSALVLETTATAFLSWEDTADFWLDSARSLGLEAYREKAVHQLRYVYVGEAETSRVAEHVLHRLQSSYEAVGICVTSVQQANPSEECAALIFSLSIGEMYVPLRIEICAGDRMHLFAKERSLRLLTENNKTVTLLCYTTEAAAAEHIYAIASQLELIEETEHYLRLYEMLLEETLEGRKVAEHLHEIFAEKGYVARDETLAILSSYAIYPYMKKKWKVLLRREKRKEPSWEEAHAKIFSFVTPIWKSLVADTIFFGDWMPQLGRFLD